MLHRPFMVLVFLPIFVAHAPADDSYTLKLKGRAKGQRVIVENTETREHLLTIVFPDEERIEQQKDKRVLATRFEQVILETDKVGIRRLQRKYDKAMSRDSEGKIRFAPFHGKSVLMDRNKNRDWECRIEGNGALLNDDELTRDLPSKDDNRELAELLIPTKPVNVGKEWKIDTRRLASALKFPYDPASSKGSGRLDRVYRKDGRLYGVLVIRLDLAMKGPFGDDDPKPNLKPGSKFVIDCVQRCCIDGTRIDTQREMSMTVNLDVRTKVDDKNVKGTGKIIARRRDSTVEILND